MGVEDYIFWSEIRSGFEEQGGTPHQEFPGVSPTPRACSHKQKPRKKVTLQLLEDLVGLVGKTMNKQS